MKLIKENPDEYLENDDLLAGDKKDDKYVMMQVYQKITVKSCFKDYDVICEEFEHKSMV